MRVLTIAATLFAMFWYFTPLAVMVWLLAIPGLFLWWMGTVALSFYLDEVGISWGLWDENYY